MSVSGELAFPRATLQKFLWRVVCLASVVATALAEIHTYSFNLAATPVTRLCKTQNIITVNGQFPGPTLHVRNGDTLIVKVHNHAKYNATIHWHGVRQRRTGWADGPAYITQCPIRPGGSYTYRFTISGQEGTLWWHAHSSWLRASVYGALIVYPKHGSSYPFATPSLQTPILLGEWWNNDPVLVENEATRTGGPPNVSDAFTINGQPGDLYDCSKPDTFRVSVKHGQTNLLRVINGAVNNELFFAVADHQLTVVSVDALYTKPYKTDVLLLGPGQTTDVLLTCKKPPGKYYMAARSYSSIHGVPFDSTITTAILEYEGIGSWSSSPRLPNLPLANDTAAVTRFFSGLRSLASIQFPVWVPQTVEEDLLFTIGLGLMDCPPNRSCAGPNGKIFAASINNISFVLPRSTSMLQAHYYGIKGVFTRDFPDNPVVKFNYTADNVPRSLWCPVKDTRAKVLKYNTTVQIVFQGTSFFAAENHPIHIHGYDFYIVGAGFGNYDPQTDPQNFNLVDPPRRNTVGVPVNGWAAIRFVADNPGVWLMHCHLDAHITWGLATTLLVENGPDNWSSLEPPPADLPNCH